MEVAKVALGNNSTDDARSILQVVGLFRKETEEDSKFDVKLPRLPPLLPLLRFGQVFSIFKECVFACYYEFRVRSVDSAEKALELKDITHGMLEEMEVPEDADDVTFEVLALKEAVGVSLGAVHFLCDMKIGVNFEVSNIDNVLLIAAAAEQTGKKNISNDVGFAVKASSYLGPKLMECANRAKGLHDMMSKFAKIVRDLEKTKWESNVDKHLDALQMGADAYEEHAEKVPKETMTGIEQTLLDHFGCQIKLIKESEDAGNALM